METITVECPRCGTRVEATGEMLEDRVVQCTNPDCQQAFQVDLPTGRVVESRHDEREPHSERPARGGEQTLIELHPSMARRHPFQFIGSLVLLLAGLAGIVFGWLEGAPWLAALSAAAVLLAGGLLLVWWLRVISTTLTVTTERTTLRKGLLSRRTTEVRHDDVRNLQVHQTFVERMFGVGDLAISSAGQDDLEIDIDGVRGPEEIASIIRQHQD